MAVASSSLSKRLHVPTLPIFIIFSLLVLRGKAGYNGTFFCRKAT